MKIFKRSLLTASVFAIAACANTTFENTTPGVDAWAAKFSLAKPRVGAEPAIPSPPPGVVLPIKSSLIVYMPPGDLLRATPPPATSSSNAWLQEGKIIQQAAVQSFQRVFERVSTSPEPVPTAALATVGGNSNFNPTMGTYFARVVVTFSPGKGAAATTFQAGTAANGSEQSDFVRAVDAAFRDIEAQLLKDPALLTALGSAGTAVARLEPAATAAPNPAPAAPAASAAAPVAPTAIAAPQAKDGPSPQQPGPVAAIQPSQASAPARPVQEQTQLARPPAVQLPIPGDLAISMPPEAVAKQTQVTTGGRSGYSFKEGVMVQSTATKAFALFFERVSTVERQDGPYPMVKVEGGSAYNPTIGTCFVKVIANFFAKSGDPAASLAATASGQGEDEGCFQRAYDAAFRDIQRQFIGNGALIATLGEAARQPSAVAISPAASIVPIPNKGRLVVYMAPEDLARQTVAAAGAGYAGDWFAEGQIMQRAAIRTFGKVFAQVSPGDRSGGTAPVLTVQGNSSLNPLMKTYTANVIAIFSSPDGAPIGKFEGRATVDEPGQAELGFEKAYEAAFQVIVNQLVKAGHL